MRKSKEQFQTKISRYGIHILLKTGTDGLERSHFLCAGECLPKFRGSEFSWHNPANFPPNFGSLPATRLSDRRT